MTMLQSSSLTLWQLLSESSLWWLVVTLLVFQGARWLHQRSKLHPLLNPVMLSIIIMVGILLLSDADYERYAADTQLIHFLLGPATVALAIPLYKTIRLVRERALALLLALLTGSLFAAASALGLALLLGLPTDTLLSLAPKSITTPIAMDVALQIGGTPALAAALVILTGIVGVLVSSAIFRYGHIRDEAAQGFALGLAAHGIGTAQAFQRSERCGAFAGLAMGLNGVATAILVPLLLRWWGLG